MPSINTSYIRCQLEEKIRKCLCHILVRKLMEQLVGDFRDGTSSKSGRPSSSDKEERLNGKLHILRHCQNVNHLYLKPYINNFKILIYYIFKKSRNKSVKHG